MKKSEKCPSVGVFILCSAHIKLVVLWKNHYLQQGLMSVQVSSSRDLVAVMVLYAPLHILATNKMIAVKFSALR